MNVKTRNISRDEKDDSVVQADPPAAQNWIGGPDLVYWDRSVGQSTAHADYVKEIARESWLYWD